MLPSVRMATADADERDKSIERAASRWGILCWCWESGWSSLSWCRAWCWINSYSGYLLANLLFLIFIVAELANIVARLLYYRRVLILPSITNQVRRLRFDANEMSQQALADAVGVTRQTIIAIEKNKYSPSLGGGIQNRSGL